MREISEAILDDVRDAVPLPAEAVDTERYSLDGLDECVWIRPASVSRGSPQLGGEMKRALLVIDVFTKSVNRLHEITGSLVFLDGYREAEYAQAKLLHYREESAVLDEEAENYHYVLTYSVDFYDTRRAALY